MSLKVARAIRLLESGPFTGGGRFPIWQSFEAAHKMVPTAMPTNFDGPFELARRPAPGSVSDSMPRYSTICRVLQSHEAS